MALDNQHPLGGDEFILIEGEEPMLSCVATCAAHIPKSYDDEVVCECGRRTPVIANATTIQLIQTWNEMVERENRSNSE